MKTNKFWDCKEDDDMNIRDVNIILDTNADWEKLRNKMVLVTGATGRLGM